MSRAMAKSLSEKVAERGVEMGVSGMQAGRVEREVTMAAQDDLSKLESAISVKNLVLYYGSTLALKSVSCSMPKRKVTALIGPSGCGKSSFLRCFNRMNDLVDVARVEGQVLLGAEDLYSNRADVTELRKKVGMVFQKSNPFPKTIFENVAYGLRIHGYRSGKVLDGVVENSLKKVALWGEVADRLHDSAFALSGGQQQRLCIARAIAIEPEILLMDEPCSALDPIATAKIEDLIYELKDQYTIIIVTHNMQQAARVSDFTGFMLHGELVEFGKTSDIFRNPTDKRTLDYVMGRFG